MSDTRYPTRMHEVLGVETGERFKIEKLPDEFYLNHEGRMTTVTVGRMFNSSGDILTYAINNGIIRKPRLSEEQVAQLRACIEWFDLKWLAKQRGGTAMAFEEKPHKEAIWFSGTGDYTEDYGWCVKENSPICSLVSWSDPEPLDIVQTLRDAGVVVSEMEKTTDEGVE